MASATEPHSDTQAAPSSARRSYAYAALCCVALTLLMTPLANLLDPANVVMLYLLGTVGIALRWGRGPSALASMLNVVAFDFFFVSPRFSFAVNDVQYIVTFAVMLAVGLLTGQLTAGLRFQANIAASRERRAQSLFELSRELSSALLASQVVQIGESAVQRHFGGSALVLLPDSRDPHESLALPEPMPAGFEASMANAAYRTDQALGPTTADVAAPAWHYVPLVAPMRVRGVLALQPAQPRWPMASEQHQQLDTFARQIAIALERVHYVEVSHQALIDIESERLRNALLAAISHDVRTPLTALVGLAETLRHSQPALTPAQAENAAAIAEQARELATLTNNLLDMARLQSGNVSLRLEWQSVEEVVGSALRSVRSVLAGKEVRVHVPADLPLVEFDATLIERVLVNLLENAAKYGAPPIEVSAHAQEGSMVLSVRDHGPGLPPSLQSREHLLFEKFTRGHAESATTGVGLGLAICKAVVDAHRGEIRARNASTGGAEFTVTLPRKPAPLLTE
ncbi:DUF4118 domain-containing protein [Caenimonas koreensis DSM 17982]|uniref:histidine kinase n=1 Tax=Caenimonas koreensis DSM 17982 TaxID=1121255 RepID=A0A844B8U8_9BURK|nr:DUF4118 domain-containing protein [Caenimonas koreensis DSM 17982]